MVARVQATNYVVSMRMLLKLIEMVVYNLAHGSAIYMAKVTKFVCVFVVTSMHIQYSVWVADSNASVAEKIILENGTKQNKAKKWS